MRLIAALLALFVCVPLVELTLLLLLADYTHWTWALTLVLVTGLLGSLLARAQGWQTYRRIQTALRAGTMPGDALLDAVLIFFAGGLLLTPGILTDALGLSLLTPPGRSVARRWLMNWLRSRFRVEVFRQFGQSPPPESPADVVDSEFIEDPCVPRRAPRAVGSGANGDAGFRPNRPR